MQVYSDMEWMDYMDNIESLEDIMIVEDLKNMEDMEAYHDTEDTEGIEYTEDTEDRDLSSSFSFSVSLSSTLFLPCPCLRGWKCEGNTFCMLKQTLRIERDVEQRSRCTSLSWFVWCTIDWTLIRELDVVQRRFYTAGV